MSGKKTKDINIKINFQQHYQLHTNQIDNAFLTNKIRFLKNVLTKKGVFRKIFIKRIISSTCIIHHKKRTFFFKYFIYFIKTSK